MSRNLTGPSKNPFFVEEYEDDNFLRRGNQTTPHSDPFQEDDGGYEDYQDRIQAMKQQSMNRQLQGTQRALAGLYESEQVGTATAEELVRQGEQLDNIETKLDQTNQDLKTSARHITSIKSVFGSIKNWWNKDKAPSSRPDPVQSSKDSKLRDTIESPGESSSSGGGSYGRSTQQTQDVRGFYEPDVAPASRQTAEWKAYENQMDSNLDMMASGLSRLKNLGMGLGEEIERQNEQLDRITDKTDRADTTVRHQNREIGHILKK